MEKGILPLLYNYVPNHMDQREEKISALLLDNRFVDWVINPQSPYSEYWLQWKNLNTNNAELAEEASSFLLGLRNAEHETDKVVNEATMEQMLDNIRRSIDEDSSVVKLQPARRRWQWIAAAAVIGIVVFLGIGFFKRPDRQLSRIDPAREVQASPEMIRYNGGEKNELIFLPDGSKVILAKGSRISYDRLMNGQARKVSLSGEAFFDVAKNPEKPFYIHTQNMIIKVLGTSFRVTASTGKESVIVKSGKVSVYLKDQDLEQAAAKILSPRQVCTYSAADNELVMTGYTGKSKIEIEAENSNAYYFEEAPVDTVFKTLEKMYGLPLHYDNTIFKNCFVTISLENESLEEKLEILTKTVGASFSISDYGISIEGNGCK